jgi:hypothetical protein
MDVSPLWSSIISIQSGLRWPGGIWQKLDLQFTVNPEVVNLFTFGTLLSCHLDEKYNNEVVKVTRACSYRR